MPAGSDLDNQLFRTDSDRSLIVQAILARAREQGPSRVVVDSLTRLRELICGVDEFRHEVLALIRGLTELGATVLLTSEHITKLRGSGFQHERHVIDRGQRHAAGADRSVGAGIGGSDASTFRCDCQPV